MFKNFDIPMSIFGVLKLKIKDLIKTKAIKWFQIIKIINFLLSPKIVKII